MVSFVLQTTQFTFFSIDVRRWWRERFVIDVLYVFNLLFMTKMLVVYQGTRVQYINPDSGAYLHFHIYQVEHDIIISWGLSLAANCSNTTALNRSINNVEGNLWPCIKRGENPWLVSFYPQANYYKNAADLMKPVLLNSTSSRRVNAVTEVHFIQEAQRIKLKLLLVGSWPSMLRDVDRGRCQGKALAG